MPKMPLNINYKRSDCQQATRKICQPEKGNIMSNPEKKKQAVKKRYHDKSESIRQSHKGKYLKNQVCKITYQKAKYQENPKVQLAYKKCKYLENPEMSRK